MAGGKLLVGRSGALAALQDRLEAAMKGSGSLVLIRGEAGIGKTSLAMGCGERAEILGADFLVGRCYKRTNAPNRAAGSRSWKSTRDKIRALS